jgi:hypothetical protein
MIRRKMLIMGDNVYDGYLTPWPPLHLEMGNRGQGVKGVRSVGAIIFILFLLSNAATAQRNLRPDIRGIYPASIFVVTNRLIEKDKKGNVVYANKVDTANSLKYLKVTYSNDGYYSDSYGSLDELLNNPAPYHDWAIWVHGDGQSFLLSMKRGLEIQHLHKVNLIVFAWPTKAPDIGPVGNFKNSMQNVKLSAPFLGEICRELKDYRARPGNSMTNENLSIFFHSLGNNLLENTIEGPYLKDINRDLFDNLVINAAAVDSKDHNEWVEKLEMQKRICIINNGGDKNLRGLRILTSYGLQLGERPLPPLAGNAVYVDFTDAVGNRYSAGATHSFYYDKVTELSSNIREFYTQIFHGEQVIFKDPYRFVASDNEQVKSIKF